MIYFVALVSVFLVVSATAALRPSRKGIFAVLAYPVGWAAGELPAQAIISEGLLLGLLWWWGWPGATWQRLLVLLPVAVVVAENLALIGIQFYARTTVRRAMRQTPFFPLEIPRPRDDVFGSWWRTLLQFPYHPRDMQLTKNVVYGPHARNRLDVWRESRTPAGAPVIFYVHGGSWIFGDKREQGRPMLHEFMKRGYVIVAINYRLAPKNPWPAQIEDVVTALAWVKKNIHAFGGDPDRVVIAGASAGGHLASLAALAPKDPQWCPPQFRDMDLSVRGAMSFYGVLEMTGDETHWRGLGKGLRLLLEGRVVQRPYEEHRELYETMSPLHRLHPSAPAFFVVQGVTDTLVDVQVARSFVAAHRSITPAPVFHVELPFTQHAFDLSASVRTSATTRSAVAFAELVSAPRPSLPANLLASYQVPPTELLVEVTDDFWRSPGEVVRERGPFVVITAHNPFSQPLGAQENERRHYLLGEQLRHVGWTIRESVASDPSGAWPSEVGYAVFGQSVATLAPLARLWGQYALYDVSERGVVVHDVH